MNKSNISEVFPPDNVLQMAAERLSTLKTGLKEAERRLRTAPKGHLRISRKKRGTQYYCITKKGDKNGHYIRKTHTALVAELGQKAFDSRTLKSLKMQMKCFQKITRTEGVLQEQLKKLASLNEDIAHIPDAPLRLSDAQYIALWKAIPYRTKGILPEEQLHFSSAGLAVRSKSEELIANALDAHDIPFRYEAPVKVEDIWHPDFYCLNVRTRQELIWEHFGMMDDNQYLDNALGKLKAYQAHGFLLGHDLVFSWETKSAPLSSTDVEELIKAYLL